MSGVPRTNKVYEWERLLNEKARQSAGNRSRNLENSAMNMGRNNNNSTAESKAPSGTVKPSTNGPLRTDAQGALAKRNRENNAGSGTRAGKRSRNRENPVMKMNVNKVYPWERNNIPSTAAQGGANSHWLERFQQV